jgi:hypothetical protein
METPRVCAGVFLFEAIASALIFSKQYLRVNAIRPSSSWWQSAAFKDGRHR